MVLVVLGCIVGAAMILKATADAASASVTPRMGGLATETNAGVLETHATSLAAAYPQTAEALRDRADLAHAVSTTPAAIPSPFPGVGSRAWAKFVALFQGANVGEVSPAYQFGLFNIGYRRLADLGLATGVHRGLYNGRSVWLGRFVAPVSV